MVCKWCNKEAADPRFYFEIMGVRFALCEICANVSRDIFSLVNYLIKMSKKESKSRGAFKRPVVRHAIQGAVR